MNNSCRYKILLADHEPRNIKDLFEQSNPDNDRMIVSSNGKIADEQALKHQPDASMIDWDMPEMNRMEAIEIIMNNSIRKIK